MASFLMSMIAIDNKLRSDQMKNVNAEFILSYSFQNLLIFFDI